MRRNHLKGRKGDPINAVLAPAGYLWRALLLILARALLAPGFA